MTQIGEAVSAAMASDTLDEECPFKLKSTKNPSLEAENPAKDDRAAVKRIQCSNGGRLGENLSRDSPAGWGASATINELHQPPDAEARPRVDSKTDPMRRVQVKGTPYPYKVAAHHLIPGEASLANSDLYKHYMKKGDTGKTTGGKDYEIQANIGYNVNGSHNGVWLPGNYGIRGSTSPKTGSSWSKIVEDPTYADWCWEYMLACVERVDGQFHDAHTVYNEAVLDVLKNIHLHLNAHQDTDCKDCKGKKEIDPPYGLKSRLYRLSSFLEGKLKGQPGRWKAPWFTSDRFRPQMMKHGLLGE
jgi:hypothetical protein